MYESINGWTKQTIIDHITKHATMKSINNSNLCLYRGPNGEKCAVGLFIPDEFFNPKFNNTHPFIGPYNGAGVDALLIRIPQLKQYMPLELTELLALQKVHDNPDIANDVPVAPRLIEWVQKNVK